MSSMSIINIKPNVNLSHSNILKERKFLPNTELEYRIGNYLLDKSDEQIDLTVHVDMVQSKGDFSLGLSDYELKENRGALSSGSISLEMINTDTMEPSGLMRSVLDEVQYFLIYLPVYTKYDKYKKTYVDSYNYRHKELKNNLILFNTIKLYEYLISREELEARNNKERYSNALCYKLPVSYIKDSKRVDELIVDRWIVEEQELNKITIPDQLYSLFKS